MMKLGSEEIKNLLYGVTFLGTGGGGKTEKGMKLLTEDLEKGVEFYLSDLNDLKDAEMIASPYYVGAVGRQEKEELTVDPALVATNILEDYTGTKFSGIIAAELGGYATAGALHVAGLKGIPLLDADAAGRAAPDLQCSLLSVSDVPMAPFAVFTSKKDALIMKTISSDTVAEALVRGLAARDGAFVGICDHPSTVKTLKQSVALNTITKAIQIGKALRSGSMDSLLKENGVYLLFQGKLQKTEWEIREGFTYGTYELEGVNDYSGRTFKVDYKNENLVSWIDGQVHVMTPDLISMTDTDLVPATNPILEKGKTFDVFGAKADDKWRTPNGLKVMSPEFFGYDMEYRPIEEVLRL